MFSVVDNEGVFGGYEWKVINKDCLRFNFFGFIVYEFCSYEQWGCVGGVVVFVFVNVVFRIFEMVILERQGYCLGVVFDWRDFFENFFEFGFGINVGMFFCKGGVYMGLLYFVVNELVK